jgi:TPR repeat protein
MIRTCPSCKSHNARRSSVRASEITFRHIFFSPYRCRDCRFRFWVVSRNVYYFAGVVALAMGMGAVAWHLGAWLDSAAKQTEPPAGAAVPRLAELIKLAEANDAAAEHELAKLYGIGIGVPANPKEEHHWLERAARHGDVEAQYELGLALRDGRGTIQDFDASRKWLQRAAEGGNGKAQYALGQLYRTGMGTSVDNVKAYVWLNVAAAQGVSGAALARDSVLGRLSSSDQLEAQAEARRMGEIYIPKAASAK